MTNPHALYIRSLATTLFAARKISTYILIEMGLDILPCLRIETDFLCNNGLFDINATSHLQCGVSASKTALNQHTRVTHA